MMPAMSRSLLWFVPAFAVGVLVRLWNIENQIVGGDELHAVRRSLTMPLSEILVTYHESDNCLPLTAIYRMWIDSGRPLTEMVLRVPVLLSGFALLLLAPWAVTRKFGARTGVVLAWLLAISPLLINYSRTVRSYMPSVTLACLAVVAFMTWWRGGGRAWVLVYVLIAALAVYFHPLVASFVLAPGVFAALDLWFRREADERPSFAALIGAGLGLAIALASFIVPALPSLRALLDDKVGSGTIETLDPGHVLQLMAGTHGFGFVPVWLVVVYGWQRLLRKDTGLAYLGLLLIAAQLVGLAVLRPTMVERGLVLTRYILVLLPLVLFWAALGLEGILEAVGARLGQRAAGVAGGLAVCALVLAGPLTNRQLWTTSFTNHNDYVDFTVPVTELEKKQLPAFYRGELEPGAVVESPWPSSWWMGRTAHLYQLQHGRRVLVTPVEAVLHDRRLAFRNYATNLDQAVSSGARYLIVHSNLPAEELRLPELPTPRGEMREGLIERMLSLSRDLGRDAAARFGPPAFKDQRIRVWDLHASE